MSEYAEAVEYMSSAGSVWHVRVRFEILLLLNMEHIWIVFYVEDCGVRSAQYCVHLVGVNRLSACRKFFLVGKMAQDVRMV